jgi:hypothetical protein
MNRMFIILAGATAISAVACDKSASDAQERADKAQAKANTEITSAEVKAAEKANNAQAQANKEIAQAQADFSKTVEDYRHEMQANLNSIDQKLSDFDAKAMTATDAKRVDLVARSRAIHAQRDALATDFKSIDYTETTTWDTTKARLDKEWSVLHAAADKDL